MEPDRISAKDIARLGCRIAGTEILHDRRWPAARDGDVAAAVAVAIDHLHRRLTMTQLTDLIVGNLLPLAMSGDATAALVIGHALRTFGRLDPSRPDLLRLAQHWVRTRTRHGNRQNHPAP